MKRTATINMIHHCFSQKEKLVRTNKYLEEIKPLLIILRGFGRFPFLFENERVVFKPLSWPVWYTMFIVLLQFLGTCYILKMTLVQISTRGNFDDLLYCVALGVSLFQSLAIPITYWWESAYLLRYINYEWYYFQEEFGKHSLDFSWTKPIKIVSIIHVPIFMSMMIGGAYLLSDIRFIIFTPCVTALGSFSATLMVWSITLYEMRAASEKLLKRIIAAGCRNMYQYRILWLKLSNLTTSLGECVGYTGLAVCILLFTTFVLTTYGLLSLALDHSFNKSFYLLLYTSLFCVSVQFIMCDAAHRTTRAVGEKFSSKLLELSKSVLTERDRFEAGVHHHFKPYARIRILEKVILIFNLYYQMTFLLQTMMANPPIIHFLGYIVIDRNLFVKFVSDTVTYLVVLIQFKTSSLVKTSNKVFN